MLKVMGTVYTDRKDDLDEIVRALKAKGLDVAYVSVTTVSVVKEVESLNESENQTV